MVFRYTPERYIWDVARVRLHGWAVVVMMVTAIIAKDGSITLTADTPEDFEAAREHSMAMMVALADGSPIAYADCIDPKDQDDIARRLANMITGGAA